MESNASKYKIFPTILFLAFNCLYFHANLYGATKFSLTQTITNQTIPVINLADLDFRIRVETTTIAPSDVIPFYLTITNTTNLPLNSIALVTMSPNHTSFAAAESTAGWLQSGSDSALCYDGLPTGFSCALIIDSLLAGETIVKIFAVKVDPNIPLDSLNISLSANIYPADQQPPTPYIAPPVSGQNSPDKALLFLPFFN